MHCGGNCAGSCQGWGACKVMLVVKILLIIGGLNWGLVGLGMLMDSNWNVVNMVLGEWPGLEAVIYVLVGIAALVKLIGCKCNVCKTCVPAAVVSNTPETPKNM